MALSAAAVPQGRLLLGEMVDRDQPVQGQGLLPEVQVLALQVLYQSQQGGALVVDLERDAGDLFQSCQLGGPEPPFPGYQLPAVCPTAHSQGLEQPQSLDGTSQLLQFLGAKNPAGLIGIG